MIHPRPRWSRHRAAATAVLVALLAMLGSASRAAVATNLGEGRLRLVGAAFDVEPVAQTVPIGVPASVRTVFAVDPATLRGAGLRISAELSGPGLAAPVTLTTLPGEGLLLPPLQLKGEYRLSAIRMTDGAGTSIPAAHANATVTVTDVLVSSLTSRVLTPAELADRGIVVDDRSFRAFSYSLGLALDGRTIGIELPPLVWNGREYEPVGPPRIDVDRSDERFQPPAIIALPLRDQDGIPPPFEREEMEESGVAPPPVFGLLVFPGNVRFLNQFLSVVLMVQNGGAVGSNLALRDVSTRITLPPGALRSAGTTPAVPDGEPIPVRHPGPDGLLGTPDDLSLLIAQQTGTAELVAEGLKVGTHEVTCEIGASIEGLAGQPPRRLAGRARGHVVVRDPSFALTFHHPEIVRKDEEYDLRVGVANTSAVRANQVRLGLDAGSLSGAVVLDVPPGGEAEAELGDILPGDASEARFRLRATRTGRVVASSFSSDGSVSGSLRLRTAVTNDGTPLSPDTFVFPRSVSSLPASFLDATTRLLGIAHGLATADPAIAGSLAPPGFSDGSVRDRAMELVSAGRRASLGQPVVSAVADVLVRWIGGRDEIPAFDRVRRASVRGREMEEAARGLLGELLRSEGTNALERTLLDAFVANAGLHGAAGGSNGGALVLLQNGGGASALARLRVADPQGGAASLGGPLEADAARDLPWTMLLPLDAPSGGDAAILGRLPAAGLDVAIEGTGSGTVSLHALFPDGHGGFSRARFADLPVRPGSHARVRIGSGARQLLLVSSIDDPRVANVESAAASPFGAIAASQDVEANPLGRMVTVLFNRPVAGAASDSRLWRLRAARRDGTSVERDVEGVSASSDPRLVSILSSGVLNPARPGVVRGDAVPGPGAEAWSGELSVAARLAVEGGEVAGRVLGPDGTPLAGVPVRLSEAATDDLSGRAFEATTSTTRTDAHGAFAFDFVRRQDGKPFRLDAFDPASGSRGWAAGSIRADGGLVHVDVALLGRGTVRGTVIDGARAAVAGAIVRCSSDVDSYRGSLLSGPDGSFAFPSVPIGTLQLQVEAPATRETAWATVRLEQPGAVNEVVLVLAPRPRARLSGHVERGSNGALPGVWIAGYGETGEYFGSRKSADDGGFLFESAPAGPIRLEVFDGFSREPVLVQPLTLLVDGVHDVTLVVREAARRFGSVTGTVRRVLGGATSAVAAAPVWVENGGLRTTTTADGTFRLDDVPVGGTAVVALLPSTGRAASAAATVLEGAAATVELLFPDTSLGTIRGTVHGQDGRPRADALVEIWEQGPPLRLVAGARSAGDGTFVLGNVPAGTWRVQATSVETRDGTTLRNAGAAVANLPGPGASATVVIGLRGFVEVTGRVVARVRDRSGALVESPVLCRVEVAAGGFSGGLADDADPSGDPEAGRVFHDGPRFAGAVKTEPATGAFRFPHVHGGPIRVVARNPFYGDRSVDLGDVKGDASRAVDLVFDGALGIVDGVLLAPDGTPVEGARVTLSPVGSPFGDPLEARTTRDGTFLFPLVPYSLTSHVVFRGAIDGVERFAEARVQVTPASPRARAALQVLPVGSVTVRVVRSEAGVSGPVPAASVRVEETGGPRRVFTGTADGDGVVRFEGVSAVPLVVLARKDLVAGRSAAVGFGEGFRADAVVVLAESATVSGAVRSPVDGTALPGVNVLLYAGPILGVRGAATTGPDGAYTIENVPAADGAVYTVRAEHPATQRRGSSPSFVLSAAEARSVDVTLRAVGSVTGVFRTFDAARVIGGAEVDVSAESDGDWGGVTLRVSTGEDGRYRADGVPAGSVVVRARDVSSGLSGHAAGRFDGEGGVLTLDLAATPTGRLRGTVRNADGTSTAGVAPAPEVRLDAGSTHAVRLAAEYDFAEVDAAAPYVLRASERVEPFHVGLRRANLVPGRTAVSDIRFSPLGTLRIRVVRPDPERHGEFLPAPGVVAVSCGEPYVGRFPCGAPVRSDASGSLVLTGVGLGVGGRIDAAEASSGAAGHAYVEPFGADGETRDATVVLAPRGIVRGRLVTSSPDATAAGAEVALEQQALSGAWYVVVRGVTGADGRFELRDAPLEGLVLRATTTDGRLARVEQAVRPSVASPVVETGDLVLDADRPRLVAVDPPDGAAEVGLRPTITATFSEPLGAGSFGRRPRDFVELSGPFGPVAVETVLDVAGKVLRVTVPSSAALAGATPYRLRILGSLPDLAGMPLGGDVVARFTTADRTAPTVLSSSPLPGQIQVAPDVNPFVVFTKVLDPASVSSGVRLERRDTPSGPVAAPPVLAADGRTVVLNPASALEVEGVYEVVVDGVADVAGNRMAETVRIPFRTRDDVAPLLELEPPASTTPLEGTTAAFRVRFGADDVARVRVMLVAPTGLISCGEVEPPPASQSASFSCALPSISKAGGRVVAVRAEGSDFSGNASRPSETLLTLAPDAPPTLVVTSPTAGTRYLSGAAVTVFGEVSEDNGTAVVTARLGGVSRTTRTTGSFALVLPAPIVPAAGNHLLEVTAIDAAGNAARPLVIPLGIDPDQASPVIAIASPRDGGSAIGGRPLLLVASATDDVAGAALRWRTGGGSWSAFGGNAVSVLVPTPPVLAETPFVIELEARDGAGNLAAASVTVRLRPNLPPILTVSEPPGPARVTAATSFVVSGTASDDGGSPLVTATYGDSTRTASGAGFSFSFPAPSVSAPTETVVRLVATDAEGFSSAPALVPVTVVPDVGGTPTVVLSSPAPTVLLAGSGALALTFADNVGLEEGTVDVAGGLTSGGRVTFGLSGTSVDRQVLLESTRAPFGTPARISATLRNLSARTASLGVSLPVAFHRLEAPLAAAPLVEGSVLTATFRVTPEGRARAAALRMEIGTPTAAGFVSVACAERVGPVSELETLRVVVPAGRTGLVLRSHLYEAGAGAAPAADVDGRTPFERPIETTADGLPPTIEIASPLAADTFSSGAPVAVVVHAGDDVGLRSVEVTFAGSTKACVASPCRVSFFAPKSAAAATEPIVAVATDRSGRTASATVSVGLTPSSDAGPPAAVAGDGRPPRVSFVTPPLSPAAVAPGSTYVPWVAATDEDGIVSIELSLGDDADPCIVLRMPEDDWPPRKGCVIPEAPDGTVLPLVARATDGAGVGATARTLLVVREGLRVPGPATLDSTREDHTGDRLYVEGDVEVTGELRAAELHLRAGATLRPSPGGASPDALRILVAGDLVLDAGSVIDVSGTGLRGVTALTGGAFREREGDGAPHGGDAGDDVSPIRAYGSAEEPLLPGARGGVGGTFGGGTVLLEAKRIGLAGAVEADGEDGSSRRPSWRGLGAGGSIYLLGDEIRSPADILGGRWGLLSARGGDPAPDEALPAFAAFAAGGRISLKAQWIDLPLLDVSGSYSPEGRKAGRPGTVFMRDAKRPEGVLLGPTGTAPGEGSGRGDR